MFQEYIGEALQGDEVLWRYMTLPKYLDLIQRRALFFCRMDSLRLQDSHEHSNTSRVFCRRRSFEEEVEKQIDLTNLGARHPELVRESRERLKSEIDQWNSMLDRVDKESLESHAVCCWRNDKFESHAMWQLYSTNTEGVAIKTTVDRLKNSIIDHRPIHLGSVRYYDSAENYPVSTQEIGQFLVTSISQTNTDQCLHKQPWYEYEKEVRALLISSEISTPLKLEELYVSIDLDILIESIVVSPGAPTWITEVVRNASGSYATRVTSSAMAGAPPKLSSRP